MNERARLRDVLDLKVAPVALTFSEEAPAGVPRVESPGPSGCSYWKKAAEGPAFTTGASDHYNCPVGAHTHGVDLPPDQVRELQGLVQTMTELSYIREEEIPDIPQMQEPFRFATYAREGDWEADPDVVLIRGNARQVMLLAEAAQLAGVGAAMPMMTRPTCAAIPEAMRSRRCVASLGCIGNRVYSELGDEELYFAIPGEQYENVCTQLTTILEANRQLEAFHRQRAAAVTTA